MRQGPTVSPPPWLASRVWYQVYPLGALGAERTNEDPLATVARAHRLPALERWLDHVAALGAGGLLLGPVFASLTHGYDTVDPFRVDQRLGDEDDLVRLVDACHARGLAVLLDGVFNHVSRAFPPFADVLRHGRGSQHCGWFRLDFDAGGPDGFRYATFEGHQALVALNHHSEAVLEWAVAVATHWLARGVDGWRLDAAYAVPSAFWSAFAGRVRKRFPDAFLVGEMIHGDYAEFVRCSGLHAVTQYELYKAAWSACNDRNLWELAWALERHAAFCRTFVPLTFLGNHDVTRIVSQLRDPRHLGHALAVLCTAPGTPCLYYGDELGLRGRKEHRAGGDDAIRPLLPSSPEPADAEQAAVLDLYRRLVHVRRERPWLATARLDVLVRGNEQLEYRVAAGERVLHVGLNLGAAPAPLRAGGPEWRVAAGAGGDGLPPGTWTVRERG